MIGRIWTKDWSEGTIWAVTTNGGFLGLLGQFKILDACELTKGAMDNNNQWRILRNIGPV